MTRLRQRLASRRLLPSALRRERVTCPEEAGIGLVPARAATAASERRRPACDQLTRTWAALRGRRRGPPAATGRPHRPARSARPGAARPRRPAAGCVGWWPAGRARWLGVPATWSAAPAGRRSRPPGGWWVGRAARPVAPREHRPAAP